jgi:Undecaprenyl-phosphate glucose phosphotransferase
LGSFVSISCAATIVARLTAAGILRQLAGMRVFTRHVVIAGSGEQARRLIKALNASRPRFISVLGVFGDTPKDTWEGGDRYPLLGNFDDLVAYARDHDVDDIIVSLPWSADGQISTLIGHLRQLPVNVYLGSDLIGFQLPFRSPPDHFGELPVVEVMGRPLAGWGAFQKAALDYVMGPIIAGFLLPVMILVAIAIKLDSRGPVLFRQKRYGFANRAFYIYKFRTMRHDPSPQGRTLQATRNDPRVTRVGRFLRRTSLDELPQLFNVLNGTMSLVGPRPHATDHDESFSQLVRGYFARQRVRPGITGWAQVNGFRGEMKSLADIEARVRYDIEYVENWSLLFDLRILIRTGLICLTGRNAY